MKHIVLKLVILLSVFTLYGCNLFNKCKDIKPLVQQPCIDETAKTVASLESKKVVYDLASDGMPYRRGEFVVTFSDAFKTLLKSTEKYDQLLSLLEKDMKRKLVNFKRNATQNIDTTNVSFQYCECNEFAVLKIEGGVVAPNDIPIGGSSSALLDARVKDIQPNYLTNSLENLNVRNSTSEYYDKIVNNIQSSPKDSIKLAFVDTGLEIEKTYTYGSQNHGIYNFIWKNDMPSGFCGVKNDVIGWDFVKEFRTPQNVAQVHIPADDNNVLHGSAIFLTSVTAAQNTDKSSIFKSIFVKSFDNNGIGSLAEATCGIYYAVNRGAKVINNSYVFKSKNMTSFYPLLEAIVYAKSKDVLMIAAAGNSKCELNSNYFFVPAQTYGYRQDGDEIDNVVTVAGIVKVSKNCYDLDYIYSNSSSSYVHIGAQGTIMNFYTDNQPLPGTSMATAVVSGYAASLLSLNPNLTYTQLRERILNGNQTITQTHLQSKIKDGKVLTVWIP